MKRLTFLLALSALTVGCTSRIPAGFQPLSNGKGGNGGKPGDKKGKDY
jgi:hypothetical protein